MGVVAIEVSAKTVVGKSLKELLAAWVKNVDEGAGDTCSGHLFNLFDEFLIGFEWLTIGKGDDVFVLEGAVGEELEALLEAGIHLSATLWFHPADRALDGFGVSLRGGERSDDFCAIREGDDTKEVFLIEDVDTGFRAVSCLLDRLTGHGTGNVNVEDDGLFARTLNLDRKHVGVEIQGLGILTAEVELTKVLESLAIRGNAGEEVWNDFLVVRDIFDGYIVEDVLIELEKEVEIELQGVVLVPVFLNIGIDGEALEVVDEDVSDVDALIFLQDKNLELVCDFLSEAAGVVLDVSVFKSGLSGTWLNGYFVIEGADGIGRKDEFDFIKARVIGICMESMTMPFFQRLTVVSSSLKLRMEALTVWALLRKTVSMNSTLVMAISFLACSPCLV